MPRRWPSSSKQSKRRRLVCRRLKSSPYASIQVCPLTLHPALGVLPLSHVSIPYMISQTSVYTFVYTTACPFCIFCLTWIKPCDKLAGPMYVKYNAVLRGFAAKGSTTYSATVHLICSALQKLSRISPPPPGLLVYRGNGGMAMPADFLERDQQGCSGGVECALMSTTPDRDVALGYSGLHAGKELPTL